MEGRRLEKKIRIEARRKYAMRSAIGQRACKERFGISTYREARSKQI
jgi:hypothetical protein